MKCSDVAGRVCCVLLSVSFKQISTSCNALIQSWNFKESMGARNQEGIGLSYRPAWLDRLAELIPWNRFLGSINV
jgi:hypothetical protein